MANLALGKKVLEPTVKRPELVTNGDSTSYSATGGFAYFDHPGTLTVDLEEVKEIKCVRIKFWDGLYGDRKVVDKRRYKFRLGISTNMSNWNEFYNEGDASSIGWQIFKFHDSIDGRYVRVYGLENTANHHIHIVELEVHDEIPLDPPGHIGEVTNIDLPIVTEEEKVPSKVDSVTQKSARIDHKQLKATIEELERSPLVLLPVS